MSIMKKYIVVLMIVILLFLTSCDSGNGILEESSEIIPEQSSEITPPPTVMETTLDEKEPPDETPLPLPVIQSIADVGTTTISGGQLHFVGLRTDGTVLAVGSHYTSEHDVSEWRDIVSVSAHGNIHGGYRTVGLKYDGTVLETGIIGSFDFSGWNNIVMVAVGQSGLTVGLKSDGTVVSASSQHKHILDVTQWREIVAVSAGYAHIVGLKSDGTVVVTSEDDYDVSDWSDIVAVSAGWYHIVGLKSDGTVVVSAKRGEFDVSDWSDIVAVSAGWRHIVGLKSDGTVITTTEYAPQYGDESGPPAIDLDQSDVADWRNIVAVYAGVTYTVGLKSDGTVVGVGFIPGSQWIEGKRVPSDFFDWRDIAVPL